MESTKNTLLLLVSPPQQSAPGPEKNTPDSNDADQEPPVQCILPELGRLRLSRYIYQQEPYTLTTLPLDIVLLIADKLQAVDRTMLWLTCSAFHASISMKGYHPLDCPLARTRALRLLYNSPLLPYFGHNSLAALVKWNFGAQSWWWQGPVVAESVASGVLWDENEELVVVEWQTELLGEVIVVFARLVASTAGAVEGCSSVDARSGDVTVVLAGDWVAGAALWGRVAVGKTLRESRGQERGAGQQDGGGGE
ncbi:hypothetical protein FQN49_005854 [Arthroderma sp. PD_2]|nr:hypothetical protein FQN49_005854 [Arthroderma sp. PD_2]